MTALPTAYDHELFKSHNFSCACSTVGSMDMKHPPYNKYYLKISEEHREFMYLNQVPGISEKMCPPHKGLLKEFFVNHHLIIYLLILVKL